MTDAAAAGWPDSASARSGSACGWPHSGYARSGAASSRETPASRRRGSAPGPPAAGGEGSGADPPVDPGDPAADGLAAIAALVLARPPRLGGVRLIAVDGPSGSGKTTLAAPLAARIAALSGGRVVRPVRTSGGDPACGDRGTSGDSVTSSGDGVMSGDGSASGGDPACDGDSARRGERASDDPVSGGAPGDGGRGESGPGDGSRGESGPGGGSPGADVRVAVVSTDLLATWEEPLSWWPLVEEHLLAPLAAGRAARLPVVQWVSGNPRPGGHVTVPVVDVLVLEGVSSGRAAVADRLTALVWVEVPGADVRLERAVARDGEPMRAHLRRWQRQESEHFTADRTKDRADIVIDPSLGDGTPPVE